MNAAKIHVRRDGAKGCSPLVLLHPLPHSGSFYDSITPVLAETREVIRPDYPGFGQSPALNDAPTIGTYATAIAATLEQDQAISLLGFHTGCLVATEMALMFPERISKLILIDVPCFEAQTAADMLSKIESSDNYDNTAKAGFRAAFNYPALEKLKQLSHATLVIATNSGLREATLTAARLIEQARLEELPNVSATAFENGLEAIVELSEGFLAEVKRMPE